MVVTGIHQLEWQTANSVAVPERNGATDRQSPLVLLRMRTRHAVGLIDEKVVQTTEARYYRHDLRDRKVLRHLLAQHAPALGEPAKCAFDGDLNL